jgi:uncharacterized protein YjbI with pentapeptide repeats
LLHKKWMVVVVVGVILAPGIPSFASRPHRWCVPLSGSVNPVNPDPSRWLDSPTIPQQFFLDYWGMGWVDLALGFLATAGAALGLYFGWQQNNERLITERYSKSVELLGSNSIYVRIGGIYALGRVSEDSPRDQYVIRELLLNFVRERSPLEKSKGNKLWQDQKPTATDVQQALIVIEQRDVKNGTRNLAFLNLMDLNLTNVNFLGSNLSHSTLTGSNLTNANFFASDLSSSFLNNSKLTDSDLVCANLSGAILTGADLVGAKLTGANLTGATLKGTNLREVDLKGTVLGAVDFRGAYLADADLSNLNLSNANFSGTNLELTNLQGTNLMRADLSGTKITNGQLKNVLLCETILPDSKTLSERDCKRLRVGGNPQDLVDQALVCRSLFRRIRFDNKMTVGER